jgi:hypothetical protein
MSGFHQISVATTLGNAGDALKPARGVQLDRIPITERRASFLIDGCRRLTPVE